MGDRRLFVGNLPKDVSESSLENLFNRYKVSKIDIKRKKVLDDEAVFAFVNISSENVDKCLSELRDKKLNDCSLKIEPAKESFLERLKKEHHEKYQSNNNKPNGQVTTNSFQLRQNFNGVKNKKIVFSDNDFEDPAPQPAAETTEDVPRRRNLPMFKGTASIPVVDSEVKTTEAKSKSFKGNVNVQTSANDAFTAMRKFEEFSDVWKDDTIGSNYEYRQISFKEKPKSVEEKETKSSSFKTSFNNKYTDRNLVNEEKGWSSNKHDGRNFSGEEKNEKEWPNNKHTERKLFSEEKKEKKMISWKTSNRTDEQFTEKSSTDRTETARWKPINSEDDRFKMDEKFFDANDTSAADEKRKRKQSAFDSLDDKIKNDSFAKEVFEHRQLVRYDPTRPDHKILEKNVRKTDTSIPDAKKKKAKKKEEKHQSESDKKPEPKPEVSKEKHYSVADTLKDAFKKSENQSGFSLSSLFDQKIQEDFSGLPIRSIDSERGVDVDNYRVENIPQQYSDEESEEDVEMETPIAIPSTSASEKVLGKCGVWGETFFFKENDSRFKEAIDFFKPENENKVTDFDKQRSKLRSIVRKKLQNSKKDNKLFKQKLGGKLNKSKFKMRLKKARNY